MTELRWAVSATRLYSFSCGCVTASHGDLFFQSCVETSVRADLRRTLPGKNFVCRSRGNPRRRSFCSPRLRRCDACKCNERWKAPRKFWGNRGDSPRTGAGGTHLKSCKVVESAKCLGGRYSRLGSRPLRLWRGSGGCSGRIGAERICEIAA